MDQRATATNDWITVENIPERAYDYELESRSAIEWIIESSARPGSAIPRP
jgi:predicted helicase